MNIQQSITKQTTRLNFPFLGIFLLFVLVSLFNLPILVTLWRHGFDDGTYSHAYLMPFISLYLYYLLAQTGKLSFRRQYSVTALTLLVLSCFALYVSSNAQISIGYWFSLLAVLITSINVIYRTNVYILFPAAFLIFILPFWGILTPLLQNLSVNAVTFIMSFTGVPTFVEAQFITIPAGVFEIAGGCSGLRYIIVSLAISSLFIFLYIKNPKKSLLFFSVAVLGALITNWIRITLLILIGEYTDMQSSLMDDHNAFGWYLYIPFMMLLFLWGNRISDTDLIHTEDKLKENIEISTAQAMPNKFLLLSLLFCVAFSSTTLKSIFNEPAAIHQLHIDESLYVSPSINFYSTIKRHGSNSVKGNAIVLSYYFDGSDLDGKPTYYENKIIPKGWRVQSQENTDQWQIYQVSNGHQFALVKVSYEIDGQKMSNKRKFKIKRLLNGIMNINQTKLHWSFIPCINNCKTALQNFRGSVY